MAVLMSPTEHANLWNSEVKSHRLGNFKCRCFIMADVWPSCDTLWRLRPELSLSVRLPGKQYRKIEGRNSWMRFHAKRSSACTLGSRMEDSYLPLRAFVLPPARDIDKIPKCFKSDYLVSNQLLSDLTVKSELYTKDMDAAICKGSDFNTTFSETYQPVEEPWLPKSSLLSSYGPQSNSCTCLTDEERIPHHDKSDSSEAKSFKVQAYSQIINTLSSIRRRYDPSRNFSERDQPVEEPWLFESSLFLSSNTKVDSVKKTVKDKATLCENNDQHQLVTEILMPEVESKTNAHEDSVPKVILINSSVCTMQRIAVLEDGKLVELFLEPVKSNVRCDSVYLGVVTKLVPHMGGAFVDIGSHRSSLMGIKKNREPFIFPPFGRSKEQEVNGSAFVMPEEHPGADEIQNDSDDVEAADEVDEGVIDDDSVQYLHDDDVDRDLEDDYDIQEVLKVDNGSLPGHGEVEAAVDGCSAMLDLDGNIHNMKGCSDNAPASQLQDKQKDFKDACPDKNKWGQVKKGTKIIVQVVKEGLGTKSPTLTAYPKLKSRFWVLSTRCNKIGISKKICGLERLRLRDIAAKLQPEGFGLIVRTVAAGHSRVELLKDLQGLLSTWKDITEHAKSAALAADEGVEGAAPVMLHSAMGQTLSVVQDYFSEKVKSLVVDSPRTYYEVTNYLQKIAPDLCDRVELYNKRTPLFDAYNIEEEMSSILSKRVPLSNGGYLVIEQTEALVSIDVNGGQVMLRQGTSQEKAVLNVNLAAAKQIARELRLRDIGGIIVVDFIDMEDDANKRVVYEEVKKAVERDRSSVKVSELSRHGLMEIIRKRVRPSVMFMISEPCSCCHATGRVEALETSFSKIEREICRLLATMNLKADPEKPKSWPRFVLWVDNHMSSYLTSGRRTRLAVLSSYLKVWIFLKVARGFSRGTFEVKPFTDEKDQNIQLHQVAISMLRRAEVGSHTPGRKVRVIPSKKSKSGRK